MKKRKKLYTLKKWAIIDVATEHTILSKEQLTVLLDPTKLTEGGIIV